MWVIHTFFLSPFSGDNFTGTASNERILNLEQKIYKLQEELTELHRTKGEVSWSGKYKYNFIYFKVDVKFALWLFKKESNSDIVGLIAID